MVRSSVRWLVAALCVGTAAVIAFAALELGRGDEEAAVSGDPVAVEIAGRALAVPANAIRFPDQRRPGAHPRLDLALLAPDFAGRTAATAARFDVVGQPPDVVWLTLAPAADALDSAARLATVYRRVFVGEPLGSIGGLDGRSLAPAAGYVGEEVWFEPGVVHPFVARCWPLEPDGPASTCLNEQTIGGVMVGLRFPRAMLAGHRALAAGVAARLAEWGLEAAP